MGSNVLHGIGPDCSFPPSGDICDACLLSPIFSPHQRYLCSAIPVQDPMDFHQGACPGLSCESGNTLCDLSGWFPAKGSVFSLCQLMSCKQSRLFFREPFEEVANTHFHFGLLQLNIECGANRFGHFLTSGFCYREFQITVLCSEAIILEKRKLRNITYPHIFLTFLISLSLLST